MEGWRDGGMEGWREAELQRGPETPTGEEVDGDGRAGKRRSGFNSGGKKRRKDGGMRAIDRRREETPRAANALENPVLAGDQEIRYCKNLRGGRR